MNAPKLYVPPRVIVAFDGKKFGTMEGVARFVEYLSPQHCVVKIGFKTFLRLGPPVVEFLQELGFDVFLDLKLKDIPNTVAEACQVIASMGVFMTNVHADGGRKMMEAAAEALVHFKNPPKLIAVTVLTSMNSDDLKDVGVPKEIVLIPATNFAKPSVERIMPVSTTASQVLRLALLAKECGMDGVVSSAQEAALLRQKCGPDFCLVTPGIRPSGSAQNDQERISMPRAAAEAGSNYLVVGRPITDADNPTAALHLINQEVLSAFCG